MLFAIKKLWYWTGIKKDVENYLQNCEHCQKAKPPKHKPPIQPIKVSKPRERAQMDITYLPADSIGGEKYLLIVIDMFTKFIWVKALKNRDAQSVKQFLKDTFSNEYFEIWQSDNGGEFKNHEVNQLIKEVFESVQIHGAPRKPSTQGGIERVNQTIKWKFRVKIKENPNWTSYLNDITLSYNTTFHSSIGCTPWYAEYGKDYVAPSLNIQDRQSKLEQFLEIRLQETHPPKSKEEIQEFIKKNLEKNAERMIKNQTKGSKITEFNIGDRVLVRNKKEKNKKGEYLYPYQAVISQKTIHFRYKVIWKDHGPLTTDLPNTESKCYFTTRQLKKFNHPNEENEEEPFQQYPEIEILQETLNQVPLSSLNEDSTDEVHIYSPEMIIEDEDEDEDEDELQKKNEGEIQQENETEIQQENETEIQQENKTEIQQENEDEIQQKNDDEDKIEEDNDILLKIVKKTLKEKKKPQSKRKTLIKSPSLFKQFQNIVTSPLERSKRRRK